MALGYKHLSNHVVPLTNQADFYGCSGEDWLDLNLINHSTIDGSLEWCNVWTTGCYNLWFWRNKQVHDDNFVRPPSPSRIILGLVHEYEQGKKLRNPLLRCTIQQVHVHWKLAELG